MDKNVNLFTLNGTSAVLYKDAHSSARAALIIDSRYNHKFLFDTSSRHTENNRSPNHSPLGAQAFVGFFFNKIDAIRYRIS